MNREKTLEPKHMALAGSAISIMVAAAIFAITACATMGASTEQAQAETPATQKHVHTWQQDMDLVHHDAITHKIDHEPIYEDVSVPHTVCNTCGDIIDGKTGEHRKKTGHVGYTPDVPITEQRMVSAAWTETVTDEPAYDELVTLTETCSSCGEVRDVPADRAEVADE